MFNERKKPLIFKVVPIFIGFTFIVIIGWWIFVGVVSYKAVKTVEKEGLKNVLTTIWEGAPKDLKDGIKENLNK